MGSKRKTFLGKLEDAKNDPKVQPLTGGMRQRHGEGTILIPAARQVDEWMRKVPKGRLATINQIREVLAEAHGEDVTCPIVAGIHARVAAGVGHLAQGDGAGLRLRPESLSREQPRFRC